jgi:hypothetical protein
LEHDACDVDGGLPAHLFAVDHESADGAGAKGEAAPASEAAPGDILAAPTSPAASDLRGRDDYDPIALIGVAVDTLDRDRVLGL